jgi:hypothetical protein
MWFVLLALTVVASSGALAQQPSSNNNGSFVSSVSDHERFDFDKYNEDRKARIEIWKGLISGAALLIPLLIGIYSIRAQARSNFELKAAEIVMNAKNVFGVRKRADVLRELFPDKLRQDFADSFDPQKHTSPGPSPESKLELLKLIVAAPERESEIVNLWRRMYSGDKQEQLFPGDFEKDSKEGSRGVGHDA